MPQDNMEKFFEFPPDMPQEVQDIANQLKVADFALGALRGAKRMDMDLSDPRTIETMVAYVINAANNIDS